MPLIQVTMLEGKSIEQKRKLVDRLTTVTVEELGTARAAITVTIVEVPQLITRAAARWCLTGSDR